MLLKKLFQYPFWGLLKSLTWRYKLRSLGKRLKTYNNITINSPRYVSIGNYVTIMNNVSFTLSPKCKKDNGIFIGDRTFINKWCDFGCCNKIVIGKQCMFGPFVHISDRDHVYQDINIPIMGQGSYSKGPVIIGDGCWFGFRSQVMSNVKIGKNCVIAAGCVVTKDIPDYCVVAGNPGKIVKRYNLTTKKWEKQ